MHQVSFDHCPLEICHEIFQYACTDGGKTGRSLALVSKYIRNASKPYRLQSIIIAGADNAKAFTRCLKLTPPSQLRITSLSVLTDDCAINLVSADDHAQESTFIPSMPLPKRLAWKAMSVIPFLHHDPTISTTIEMAMENSKRLLDGREINRKRDRELSETVSRILPFCGQDLRSLTLESPSGRALPPELNELPHSDHFLSISSLTIGSRYTSFRDLEHMFSKPRPSLQYLDLIGFEGYHPTLNIFRSVATLAPSLKYLRLRTGAAQNLGDALTGCHASSHSYKGGNGGAVAGVVGVITGDKLPSTTERVFIQVEKRPEKGDVFYNPYQLDIYLRNLECFVRLAKEDSRVILLYDSWERSLDELVDR